MRAVILVNFGGPRTDEEIYPFLKDIFRDVLPKPLKFIAPMLAKFRTARAQRMYNTIGGASPVVSWTKWQGQALEKRLNDLPHPDPPLTKGRGVRVYIGMKYGRPSVEEAVDEATADGAEKIFLLPLFPYRSRYTIVAAEAVKPKPAVAAGFTLPKSAKRPPEAEALRPHSIASFAYAWHTHPLYIKAMVSIIRASLEKWRVAPPPDINLLFTVHAIPKSDAGAEPYIKEVSESIAEIMKSFTGYNHYLAFQSQSGPIRWTKPNVKTVLKQIFKKSNHETRNTNHVLLIPLGFACENVETLYEIDKIYIPFAKQALRPQNVARTPALNDNPQFIDLLADLVLNSF